MRDGNDISLDHLTMEFYFFSRTPGIISYRGYRVAGFWGPPHSAQQPSP